MGNAPSSSRSSTPPPAPVAAPARAVVPPRPPQPQRQSSVIVPPRAHSPTHRGSLVLSRGPSVIPPVLSVGSPVLDDPPRTLTPVAPPSPKEDGLARLQEEAKGSRGKEEEEDGEGDEDKRRPEYSRYKTASDVLPVHAPVPQDGSNPTYTATPFSTEPEQDVGESASGDLRDASEESGAPESKPEEDKDRDGLRVTDWASAAAAMEQAMAKVKERAIAFAKEGVDRRAKAREEEERIEAARLEEAEGAKRTMGREVVGDKAAEHAGEKLEKIKEEKEDAEENMENTEKAKEEEEEEAKVVMKEAKDTTKEEKDETVKKGEDEVEPVKEEHAQQEDAMAAAKEEEDADNIYSEGKPVMKGEADEDNSPKGEATTEPHSDDDVHSDDEPHFPPGLTPNDRDTNEDDSTSALPRTLLMPSIYTGMFSRSRSSLQAQRRASDADDLGYGTQEGEDSGSEAGEMVKKADGEEAIRVVKASEESLPAEVQDVGVHQVEEVPMPAGLQVQQPLFVASSTEEFKPHAVYDLPSPLAEDQLRTRAFMLEEDPVAEAVPVSQDEDPFRDPLQTPVSTPWPPAGSSPRVLDPTVYILSDKRWGSTFDLSGGDNRSAIAFSYHGWENQQWDFSKLGAGFAMRNMRNGGYLSVANFGALAGEGRAPVVTTSFPACWDVEAHGVDSGLEEEEGDALIRIRWPESSLFLGLSDAVGGTKICLSSDTGASNVWYARVHPRPQVTYGPPTTTETTIRHVDPHRGVSTVTTTTTFTTTTTKTITRVTTSGI